MAAIPSPLVVQGNQEQVGPVQLRQDSLAVIPVGNSIAQRPAQALQDRGPEQEFLDSGRLLVENLFDQVIQDETVAPGESLDQPRHILTPLHRKGGHLQTNNPPLGALFQHSHVIRREA